MTTLMPEILKESAHGYDTISLPTDFLARREIFLTGTVDNTSMIEVIQQVLALNHEDPQKEITIYINSGGGSVESGFALVDVIKAIDAPVRTVCIGTAASMGAAIFLAGDTRQVLAHSSLMIHDPSFANLNIGGKKPHEVQALLDGLVSVKASLVSLIAERTHRDREEIAELMKTDTYFNAQEAKDFGIATEIIEHL